MCVYVCVCLLRDEDVYECISLYMHMHVYMSSLRWRYKWAKHVPSF